MLQNFSILWWVLSQYEQFIILPKVWLLQPKSKKYFSIQNKMREIGNIQGRPL